MEDNTFVSLTNLPIQVESIINQSLTQINPSAGATNIFIGTTRDFFQNKKVLRLEYEAYIDMALNQLRQLTEKARMLFENVHKIVIVHRLGDVAITEVSIVILVSSAHRHDAIHATEYILEELKKEVVIWKKEVYEDQNSLSVWKENDVAIQKQNV